MLPVLLLIRSEARGRWGSLAALATVVAIVAGILAAGAAGA